MLTMTAMAMVVVVTMVGLLPVAGTPFIQLWRSVCKGSSQTCTCQVNEYDRSRLCFI